MSASENCSLHPEDVNPFYAAFLRTQGLPETIHAASAFAKAKSNAPFMAFIARARQSAPATVFDGQRIVDRDGWAAHVDAQGWREHYDRFPNCDNCGCVLCGCPDAHWAAA